jgi:lipoyl(octanoyl) transferase
MLLPPPLRWIVDKPADGPSNMALDEAILTAVSTGQAPPTLRFYTWSPPTISLGYFQSYSDYVALPPPAGRLTVVRRLTGGGAILHDQELTYSLTLPLDHLLIMPCGPSGLYDSVHDAFSRSLQTVGIHAVRGPREPGGASHRGPFFCFERHCRYDLLVDGRKLMGSAQRRTRTAVLQHGSLILDSRFEQQACTCIARHGNLDLDLWIPRLVGEIVGGPPGKPGTLTDDELHLAKGFRAKYEDAAWTGRR